MIQFLPVLRFLNEQECVYEATNDFDSQKLELELLEILDKETLEQLAKRMVRCLIVLIKRYLKLPKLGAIELVRYDNRTRLGLFTDSCLIPYGSDSIEEAIRKMLLDLNPNLINDTLFREVMETLIVRAVKTETLSVR